MEMAAMLMNIPMKDAPKLAIEYAHHLSRNRGFCSEILITAYAHYAQAVEGFPCNDDLYLIDDNGKAWFAEHKA